MTHQKMADVAAQALPAALEAHPDLQVCILGRGEKRMETALQDLGRRYPGRCAVHVGFQEPHAHLLHAGADILLHGSRFEPFGLTPLYAMRYGTIPIGSRVGGMADTIRDAGSARDIESMRHATGVLFEGDSVADMAAAIDRTLVLRRRPEIWQAMQCNAMRTDFSWSRAAPLYLRAYRAMCPGRSAFLPAAVPAASAKEESRAWRSGLVAHADSVWSA
jgi:starch synthase